ncbi:MAG: LamG domain-containing protein, partial [Flavobacteriales bacterium]
MLLVAGLTCLCSFSQDLSQDLIVHYNFNGNVVDQGPNGLDGIGTIAYTTDPFGAAGQAGEFNGVDDFIDLPNEEIVEASFPMSVAFWLKIYTTNPQNNVFFTNDFALNNHSGMWINLSSANKLIVSVGDASGSTGPNDRRSKQGETVLEINTWYHVVAVVNGFNDMQLYLNCENDGGTYSGSANSLGYTSAPGSVGRKDIANVNTYHFSGVMDDFYYWNRVVTPEEMGFLCESNICNLDTQGPDFLNPPENVTIECGELVPDPMEVNPSDASGIASLDFQEEFIFDGCFDDIERTWVSEDGCGNQSQITQLINVVDIIPPELSYGPEDLLLNCADNIPMDSAIFTDNCDQNLNINLEQIFDESGSQCTLANPQDQGLTANYSLYLNHNEEILLFSHESSTLEFSSDSSEIYISATFLSQTDNSSGYFMYAEFENGMDWE